MITKYIVFYENGQDTDEQMYKTIAEAEKVAVEYSQSEKAVTVICEVTPILEIKHSVVKKKL